MRPPTLDVEALGEKQLLKDASLTSYKTTDELETNPQLSDDSHDSDDAAVVTEDIIQFAAHTFYVDEGAGSISLEVIRLGSHKGEVSVSFHTREATAHPDENFKSVDQEIVFKNGQGMRAIDVKILEDGTWSPTKMFSVHLDTPKGCQVGLNLSSARVKIVNEDPFPSSTYKDILNADNTMKDVDLWKLYWNFVFFNFKHGGVSKESILCIILDQVTNICLFVSLAVAVYMVDVIFDKGADSRHRLMTTDRFHDAVLVGLWYLIPVVMLFLRDAYKAHLDIEGVTKTFLLKSTMRIYLQYSESSRQLISHSDLNIAISSNADAVARGYVAGIGLPQSMGKIFTVSLFIFLYQPHIHAFCMVALMPVMLACFTFLRLGLAKRADQEVGKTMRNLIVLTEETCIKYRLIACYLRRYIMFDRFALAANDHKQSMEFQNLVALITVYITKFITGFFICAYIILNAQDVLDGKLSLGLFLATITIFATYLADAIVELNKSLQIIIETLLPLRQTTLQFNLPLEHHDCSSLSEFRRRKTLKVRKAKRRENKKFRRRRYSDTPRNEADIAAQRGTEMGGTDAVDIRLKDVSFKHWHSMHLENVLHNVTLSARQGHMIAITGPHKSHKKTLMDLLADALFPTSGHIFMPSHLRVCHVAREPIFLDTSLLHNLVLGLSKDEDINLERVKRILFLMGMDDIEHQIEADIKKLARLSTAREKWSDLSNQDSSWLARFSHSEQMKLHICRALIADANVLILQRPLHLFDSDTGNAILKVLRMYCDTRGLGYAEDTLHCRRPRTLFMNPETQHQANVADVVWTMNPITKSVDVSIPTRLAEDGTEG